MIAPELNVMLTGVGRRLQGTRWSVFIFFLEGHFLSLYVLLGGSKTRMESSTAKNTPSKSMKFYISMFNDKPPCMPLLFGIAERHCNHIARGGRGFFFFISSFLASSSTFSSFLASFLHFLFFLRLFLPLFLLS